MCLRDDKGIAQEDCVAFAQEFEYVGVVAADVVVARREGKMGYVVVEGSTLMYLAVVVEDAMQPDEGVAWEQQYVVAELEYFVVGVVDEVVEAGLQFVAATLAMGWQCVCINCC